jgi:hypothetical protein
MSFQRILCILSIIASALVFVYSLGMMTDLYDMLYFLSGRNQEIDTTLYYDMQGYVTAEQRAADASAGDEQAAFFTGGFSGMLKGMSRTREGMGFMRTLELTGIALILISCLLIITNTHARRKYYISNYFAILLVFCANVAAAVWAHIQIMPYRAKFLQLDFEAIKAWLEANKYGDLFTRSTFWFDAHYGVFAFTLVISILLIVSMIWKSKLMARERDLLQSSEMGVSA